MQRIAVYCGSSPGRNQAYIDAAKDLGKLLVDRKITLVYGGGKVGIMGILADAVLQAGGEVIGVIPASLAAKEVEHKGVTELLIVDSMHARKNTMVNLSDAFIALPGGFGTIEEIFEVITWAQLRFHAKPCGFLNVNGYFDKLMAFLDHAVQEEFIEEEHRGMILVEQDITALLAGFNSYIPPTADKASWALHHSKNTRSD